jgi:hypothetical protein
MIQQVTGLCQYLSSECDIFLLGMAFSVLCPCWALLLLIFPEHTLTDSQLQQSLQCQLCRLQLAVSPLVEIEIGSITWLLVMWYTEIIGGFWRTRAQRPIFS